MNRGNTDPLMAAQLLEEQQRVSFGQSSREPTWASVQRQLATAFTTGEHAPWIFLGLRAAIESQISQPAFVAYGENSPFDWGIARLIGTERTPRGATTPGFVYRLTGTVRALAKLRDIWVATDDQMRTLLGYGWVEDWTAVLSANKPLDRSVDRRDRVGLLLTIDRLLYGLYRNDEAVRKWLHQPNQDLDPSPLEYMLRGKLRHLYVVADYVQGMTDTSG